LLLCCWNYLAAQGFMNLGATNECNQVVIAEAEFTQPGLPPPYSLAISLQVDLHNAPFMYWIL